MSSPNRHYKQNIRSLRQLLKSGQYELTCEIIDQETVSDEGKKPYVAYAIEWSLRPRITTKKWITHHRYSKFKELNTRIRSWHEAQRRQSFDSALASAASSALLDMSPPRGTDSFTSRQKSPKRTNSSPLLLMTLPKLPTAGYLRSFNPQYIAQKRANLNQYLLQLVGNKDIASSKPFTEFCLRSGPGRDKSAIGSPIPQLYSLTQTLSRAFSPSSNSDKASPGSPQSIEGIRKTLTHHMHGAESLGSIDGSHDSGNAGSYASVSSIGSDAGFRENLLQKYHKRPLGHLRKDDTSDSFLSNFRSPYHHNSTGSKDEQSSQQQQKKSRIVLNASFESLYDDKSDLYDSILAGKIVVSIFGSVTTTVNLKILEYGSLQPFLRTNGNLISNDDGVGSGEGFVKGTLTFNGRLIYVRLDCIDWDNLRARCTLILSKEHNGVRTVTPTYRRNSGARDSGDWNDELGPVEIFPDKEKEEEDRRKQRIRRSRKREKRKKIQKQRLTHELKSIF
eukprot:g2309.t1